MIYSLDTMKESDIINQDPELTHMLEVSIHCAEFIISHVGNFLDLSKFETQKIDLSPTPTDIVDLIKKIVQMHMFKAENKNLYLRLNATDNMPDLALIDNNRLT